ncbi:uncharacterized protein [Ptychodera flava]|uniref:uncharacterized protein n=1 Tax=Ptychodera flava TaxID=63121 RepID=UPI003969BC79
MAQRLKTPSAFDFFSEDQAERWKPWREGIELYLAVGMKGESNADKSKALLYIMGPKGREMFKTFTFAEDGSDNSTIPKHILDKFEQRVAPTNNLIITRHRFNMRFQGEHESADEYITALMTLASFCDYGDLRDQLLRDRIVCGIRSKEVKEKLFQKPDLTLAKAINIYVRFKVDTGSQANIIPQKIFKKINDPMIKVQKTGTTLTSYSNNKIKVLGKCKLMCIDTEIEFYITQTDQPPLLGFQASQDLELIKVVLSLETKEKRKEKKAEIMKKFPKVFSDGLGCLAEPYHIRLDPSVTPVIHPPRKIPVALRDKLK